MFKLYPVQTLLRVGCLNFNQYGESQSDTPAFILILLWMKCIANVSGVNFSGCATLIKRAFKLDKKFHPLINIFAK